VLSTFQIPDGMIILSKERKVIFKMEFQNKEAVNEMVFSTQTPKMWHKLKRKTRKKFKMNNLREF
jgi:hypothetical protein